MNENIFRSYFCLEKLRLGLVDKINSQLIQPYNTAKTVEQSMHLDNRLLDSIPSPALQSSHLHFKFIFLLPKEDARGMQVHAPDLPVAGIILIHFIGLALFPALPPAEPIQLVRKGLKREGRAEGRGEVEGAVQQDQAAGGVHGLVGGLLVGVVGLLLVLEDGLVSLPPSPSGPSPAPS